MFWICLSNEKMKDWLHDASLCVRATMTPLDDQQWRRDVMNDLHVVRHSQSSVCLSTATDSRGLSIIAATSTTDSNASREMQLWDGGSPLGSPGHLKHRSRCLCVTWSYLVNNMRQLRHLPLYFTVEPLRVSMFVNKETTYLLTYLLTYLKLAFDRFKCTCAYISRL